MPSHALAGMVDPLPQALILTAIVIGFAVMAFLLTLLDHHQPFHRNARRGSTGRRARVRHAGRSHPSFGGVVLNPAFIVLLVIIPAAAGLICVPLVNQLRACRTVGVLGFALNLGLSLVLLSLCATNAAGVTGGAWSRRWAAGRPPTASRWCLIRSAG